LTQLICMAWLRHRNCKTTIAVFAVGGATDELAPRCDMYFASKYLQKPVFPWRRPLVSVVEEGTHVPDAVAVEMARKLGSGLQYLRQVAASDELLDALNSICEVTAALDHHVRGGQGAPDLEDLMEIRNSTHHRLLCQLPDPPDLSTADSCVLQAVRLASLIYDDMVIFPIPAVQGQKRRQASQLRQVIEEILVLQAWKIHHEIVVWALVLGAIASTHTTDRDWYIRQLLRETAFMQCDQEEALERLCSRFLWWQPMGSKPLHIIWQEMVSMVGVTRSHETTNGQL
jgi:hypothetical protein